MPAVVMKDEHPNQEPAHQDRQGKRQPNGHWREQAAQKPKGRIRNQGVRNLPGASRDRGFLVFGYNLFPGRVFRYWLARGLGRIVYHKMVLLTAVSANGRPSSEKP